MTEVIHIRDQSQGKCMIKEILEMERSIENDDKILFIDFDKECILSKYLCEICQKQWEKQISSINVIYREFLFRSIQIMDPYVDQMSDRIELICGSPHIEELDQQSDVMERMIKYFQKKQRYSRIYIFESKYWTKVYFKIDEKMTEFKDKKKKIKTREELSKESLPIDVEREYKRQLHEALYNN